MDLLKEMGLRTGTVRGNVGKSSKVRGNVGKYDSDGA